MSKAIAIRRLAMIRSIMGVTGNEMDVRLGPKWRSWEEHHYNRFEYLIEQRLKDVEAFESEFPEVVKFVESIRAQLDRVLEDFGDPAQWLISQFPKSRALKAWKIKELTKSSEFTWPQITRAARKIGVKKAKVGSKGKLITEWRLP